MPPGMKKAAGYVNNSLLIFSFSFVADVPSPRHTPSGISTQADVPSRDIAVRLTPRQRSSQRTRPAAHTPSTVSLRSQRTGHRRHGGTYPLSAAFCVPCRLCSRRLFFSLISPPRAPLLSVLSIPNPLSHPRYHDMHPLPSKYQTESLPLDIKTERRYRKDAVASLSFLTFLSGALRLKSKPMS